MSYPPISPPPGELFELCGFEKLQNHKMNNIIISVSVSAFHHQTQVADLSGHSTVREREREH
jgi:hypothetical protein